MKLKKLNFEKSQIYLCVVRSGHQEMISTKGDNVESVVTSLDGFKERSEGVPRSIAEYTERVSRWSLGRFL